MFSYDGSSTTFAYDAVGNRTTLTASGSDGFLWKYDKTNQLLVEQRTLSGDAFTHTMTYDPRGNRLTLSDTNIPPVSFDYDYDNANRRQTVTDVSGITTYTYDDNGNQHTIEEPNGDITTNTWNGENRLILVEHPDSTETVYRYNGDGLRVFQDHDGTVALFLYDGNNLLQETDDTGLVEAAFTYLPLPYAEVLSQRRDTESSFYLPDGIRNIRQLTDDAEVVTDEYAFDAFGNLRSSTGSTANSQLYKGQLLSYRNDPHAGPDSQSSMHFRNQSATTFRFTSEDPAEDDLNLYRPVGNNPVNGEDPSGLEDHQLGFSTEEKAAKKAAQERRRQLERENEERRQREVSAELDARFEVRRRTLAARKAREQDEDNKWRAKTPRGAMALNADASVSEVTNQMHQGVLTQLEPQVIGSADSPRRYGSPGENLGTYLMPGLSAVPFTVQDAKDIRQERLANEAELERSRAILEMGVPGYGTIRSSRTLLDSEATTGQKILAGISVAIDVAPAAGQLVPNLGGSSRLLRGTAAANEAELIAGGVHRVPITKPGDTGFADLDNAGVALQELSSDKIRITHKGINVAQQHLSRFTNLRGQMFGNNVVMLRDLRRIANGELSATKIHRDFYAHELREFVRYRVQGFATNVPDSRSRFIYKAAHCATLKEYRIPFEDHGKYLYTPFALSMTYR